MKSPFSVKPFIGYAHQSQWALTLVAALPINSINGNFSLGADTEGNSNQTFPFGISRINLIVHETHISQ